MRARALVVLAGLAAVAAVALIGGAVFKGGSHSAVRYSKFSLTDPDSKAQTPGLGPGMTWDTYLQAADAYPANAVTPQEVGNAEATFNALAASDAKHGDPKGEGRKWEQVGPTQDAQQPGVTAFSGATNSTASRITALVVAPDCGSKGNGKDCTVWAGAAGGGIWRTDHATDTNPDWKQLQVDQLDQASVGFLALDPTDKKGKTLYLGTGEGNRCSSGCEAGVGIYKSTNGGDKWTKLDDACVDNATYHCATPGQDAFLGRGINSIVVDPNNSNHIFVGSAQAVRGLSHVIGAGGTVRAEPGANEPGLYESTDGGSTFTEVWDGTKPDAGPQSFGITDVGLDPSDPSIVYVAGFDAGLWRRDAGAAQTTFTQVFKPQFVPPQCTFAAPPSALSACALNGIDRTMFALTPKDGHTRIYLTEGTQPTSASAGASQPLAADFWRTDRGEQSAASLVGSESLPCAAPGSSTVAPQTYTGWQCLTSRTTASPYWASSAFCTQQCWYDQDVYTPAGMPDTVYLIGSNLYGEQPCNTNGVGCGNGISNGREVIYSTTAGDPDGSATVAGLGRTFTDLSYDATVNHPSWCAYAPYFPNGCENAPNGIHPDQHEIAINPANPTQIFEGSDGGMIRTSGQFADASAQCNSQFRNGGTPLPNPSTALDTCKRLLSRIPTQLDHVDRKLSSTLQFVGVAIRPNSDCEVSGGTQDNGTWTNTNYSSKGPDCNNDQFTQIIYGDGGNAGYDLANPNWRFNQFTSAFSDSNFENGDPEKWVINSAPVTNSGEGVGFYFPEISDPNPVAGSHPIYIGAGHVWRSWAFGAGTPTQSGTQSKTPNIAGYEANCPEFVTSGQQLGCGDFRPLGGPYCDGDINNIVTPIPSCANAPGNLTGTAYGTDRSGGAISWISRDGADTGTIWAATGAGRVFVTHNGDAPNPDNVTWHRIDSSTSGASPTRYPSGIYVDPNDSGHAWISYSGYNANTSSTPGHVFDVRENGPAAGSGTFTNLHVENGTSAFPTPFDDGDLPVSDVVRDDSDGTLYASTDFGVLRGDPNKKTGKYDWHVTNMPRYEVMHLEMQPSNRAPTCSGPKKCKPVLYAATHSQGIWKLKLN